MRRTVISVRERGRKLIFVLSSLLRHLRGEGIHPFKFPTPNQVAGVSWKVECGKSSRIPVRFVPLGERVAA